MKTQAPSALTGVERRFGDEELIVSKTDCKGRITYANEVFLRVAGYSEAEILGQPHNLIRHPDMPRGAFRLLWQTIASGREFFAYVLNMASNGDHYWVLAHVSPTFDKRGTLVGYHSNRRCPDRSAVAAVWPIYQEMLRQESGIAQPRLAAEVGQAWLENHLAAAGIAYDEFLFSLVEKGS